MGWWQRWGAYVGAGVLAGASFLPMLNFRGDERLKVTPYVASDGIKVSGIRCVQSEDSRTPLEGVWGDIAVASKEIVQLQDAGADIQGKGRLFSEGPSGNYLVVIDDGQKKGLSSLDVVILDRNSNDVRRLRSGLEGFVGGVGWTSQDQLRLNVVSTAQSDSVVVDCRTGEWKRIRNEGPYIIAAALAWLALLSAASAARERLQERIPRRGGTLLEQGIRPFLPRFESYVGVATALAAHIAYIGYEQGIDMTRANRYANILPVIGAGSLVVVSLQKWLERIAKRPLLLHAVPALQGRARLARNASSETLERVRPHFSTSAYGRALIEVRLIEGRHAEAFEVVDELQRMRPEKPTLWDQYVCWPWGNVVRAALGSNKRTDAISVLTDTALAASDGRHHDALEKWDVALTTKDPSLPPYELRVMKARHLALLENLIDDDALTGNQLNKLKAYMGVSGATKELANRVHAESQTMWGSVVDEMMREGSVIERKRIGTSANSVYEFVGDSILPHALILKMGNDKQRLKREYDVTRALANCLPNMRVPRPLYFDDERGILLVERVKGTTIAESDAGNWTSMLASALGDLHLQGKNMPPGLIGKYDYFTRINQRIEPILRTIGISFPDAYFNAIKGLAESPQGLLHGDCTPLNAMVHDNPVRGTDIAFIDTESVLVGPVVKDLACFLVHYQTPKCDIGGLCRDYVSATPAQSSLRGDVAGFVYIAGLHEWIRQTTTALRQHQEGRATREDLKARLDKYGVVLQRWAVDQWFHSVRDRYGLCTDFVVNVQKSLSRI